MPQPKRKSSHRASAIRITSLSAFAAIAVTALSWSAARAAGRIRIVPRFTAGQVLRYQVETRTSTTGKATSPIVDPEAATKFSETGTLIVRLDVLDVKPNPDGSTSRVRLRATYEKSDAVLESDAYDPSAAALQDQYEKLQGRVFQFTIEPDGKVTNVSGIDDLLSNPAASGVAQGWMEGVASAAKFPAQGIAIGLKWTSERRIDNAPLAKLTFRTESTYVRDEECRSSSTPNTVAPDASGNSSPTSTETSPGSAMEVCAVILTQFRIFRPGLGGPDDDATPESYVHNHLRTSGTWTGTGESLDDISLATGMIVRSTQTSHQDMDFEITSASSNSRMQYKGHVDSQSLISLLPNNPVTTTEPAAK
jgi:hypothetical protein